MATYYRKVDRNYFGLEIGQCLGTEEILLQMYHHVPGYCQEFHLNLRATSLMALVERVTCPHSVLHLHLINPKRNIRGVAVKIQDSIPARLEVTKLMRTG